MFFNLFNLFPRNWITNVRVANTSKAFMKSATSAHGSVKSRVWVKNNALQKINMT